MRLLLWCLIICVFGLQIAAPLQFAEGATQNFSVSGIDSLSNSTVRLTAYNDLEAYVAYIPDAIITSQSPSAWLTFVPVVPSPKNYSTFVLASLVFRQASQIQTGAIFWIANRNHPVSRNFSFFLDQISGNLILRDGDGSLAWSSNVSSAPLGNVSMDVQTDPSGQILPIGTLFLLNSDNTTRWQSSDYPTHALAPPQFLKPGTSLVSSASISDPSDGLYRLVMEPGGLVLYYDGHPGSPLPYWVWNYYGGNHSWFNATHTCRNLTQAFMTPDGGLILSLTTDAAQQDSVSVDLCEGVNTTLSLRRLDFDNFGTVGNDDVIILSLQYDGNLLAHSIGSPWAEVFDVFDGNKCLLPNFCGSYGICSAPSNCECPSASDGYFPPTFLPNRAEACRPLQSLSCNQTLSEPGGQRLLRYEGLDYFANKYSTPLNDLISEQACQDACLQRCSCLAAFWYRHSNSCFHVSDSLSSLQGSLGSDYVAFLKVEAIPEVPDTTNRTLLVGLVSGASATIAVAALVAGFIVYYKKTHKTDDDDDEEDALWTSIPGAPRRFSFKEVQSITNNFSAQIGKGGFGTVFAGTLQDGTKVAVKRLESLRQGAKEFRAEILILGGVRHYNLVELVGYCAEGSSHRLLVYEYMANGSLDQWLFAARHEPNYNESLPWKLRFSIAIGTAKGLSYLHDGWKDTVVHLDIKPPNILLDENFVAKVSDFGLSKLMGRDETHVITTMRGTPGYLAPEWLAEGSDISSKCDVFSYGKLLMELIGARKNLDPSMVEEQEKIYFPAWLYLRMTREGGVQDAELKSIAGAETEEEIAQAKAMAKTAFLCLLENPSQRPSMDTVVQMLEGRITMLEKLNVSDLFQGLHFALRMPSPSLANHNIAQALALIFDESSSSLE